ncbi:hypothetical protein IWW56_003257 [Coemansia sp. RSA 2131]|nr:hypothetical protein IWW56_003257 [Coemansia sp. RSA 2131]
MSWAPTGANTVPLGRRRGSGAASEQQKSEEQTTQGSFDAQNAVERARAIANSVLVKPPAPDTTVDSERKRRRKNRWGARDTNVAASAALTSNMSKEQAESYAAILRIDEITRRLRTGDVVPPDGQRSRSPPPTYNTEGKRTNTREHRYRRRLEDERIRLVEDQLRRDPAYRPPADFRRRSRYSEKVFIPVDENPGLNFIGLLIGPRGNTLKKIEGDSGCKISIRGRGSIKEGKRRDDTHIPGADEDLHCHIVADSEEKVKRGIRLVREIIQKACVTPEGHNDLKRNQLRELAALNGTLRDDEGQACTNCGSIEHRKWECTEASNVTLSLVCSVCGGRGHPARDCALRHDPDALGRARERDQQLNSEYLRLMDELGETAPGVRRENSDIKRRLSGSDYGAVTRPPSAHQSPGPAPWLRDTRSPHNGRSPHHTGHDYSRAERRPAEPPATPPWIRRRPADRFYPNGFRDPRPLFNEPQALHGQQYPQQYPQQTQYSSYGQPPPPGPDAIHYGGYRDYSQQAQSYEHIPPPPPPDSEPMAPPPPPSSPPPPPPPE